MFVQPENGSKYRRQAGQTISIVAVSILALIAMAALAIDVATLHVARTAAQRAADAAALAGAKVFVSSGYTHIRLAAETPPPLVPRPSPRPRP